MISVMRVRVLTHKLEVMAQTFTYGADSTGYVSELLAEIVAEKVAKHQLALSAAIDFDLDDPDKSLATLEEVWFLVAPIFESSLTEFKVSLAKHQARLTEGK